MHCIEVRKVVDDLANPDVLNLGILFFALSLCN